MLHDISYRTVPYVQLNSARRFSGMEDPESPDIVLNLNSDAPPEIKVTILHLI